MMKAGMTYIFHLKLVVDPKMCAGESFSILSISTEKEREKYGYGIKNHISCMGKERVRVLSQKVGTEKVTGTGHFTLQKYGNGYGQKFS